MYVYIHVHMSVIIIIFHDRRPEHAPPWGCVLSGTETGLPCLRHGWPKKESPFAGARLVVVVKAFVSSRVDARDSLSKDPNVSS